jgi:hypothetical protein
VAPLPGARVVGCGFLARKTDGRSNNTPWVDVACPDYLQRGEVQASFGEWSWMPFGGDWFAWSDVAGVPTIRIYKRHPEQRPTVPPALRGSPRPAYVDVWDAAHPDQAVPELPQRPSGRRVPRINSPLLP